MSMACSVCTVLLVLAGCHAGPGPSVLAGPRDGVSRPYGVALDASRVYWTERGNGGAIRAVAKAGGPVTTLVRGCSPYAWFCAVDDRHVYWTEFDAGTLRRAPKAGGPAETWERGLGNPGQLAIHRGWVYWVEYAGNVLKRRRAAPGSGPAEVLVAGLAGPQALAVDDQAVTWTEYADPPVLRSRPLAGGRVVTLATVSPECWLLPDGESIWFTETRGFLRRWDRRTGAVRELAAIPSGGAFAALTPSFCYWAEEFGHRLMRVPRAGGPPQVVLSGLGHPEVMAADADAIYWADGEADTILRLPERPR